MRNHMWMHTGILGAIVLVLGLGALGVAVPTAGIYLILLACPLMMIYMMFGMNHNDATPDGSGEAGPTGASASDQQVHPPSASPPSNDSRPDTMTDARGR